MTQQTKQRVKRWAGIIAVLIPAFGWALTSSASVMDSRYVHATEYANHKLLDSVNNSLTQQKLDSLMERVKQIKCGATVALGCR